MSIKRNIKRRVLMMVALAMSVTVLAAGTAHARTSAPEMSVAQTASSPEFVVGEPVTFHITLTNESSYDISTNDNSIYDVLPADVQFVSASTSQGQYTFEPTHLDNGDVHFDTGTIPPGGTVQMDVVVVPQKAGAITNKVQAPMSSSEATVFVDALP
jgi:uncharacterized repeat protein (TIGR01451 family)